jgi:hypothetical protein
LTIHVKLPKFIGKDNTNSVLKNIFLCQGGIYPIKKITKIVLFFRAI